MQWLFLMLLLVLVLLLVLLLLQLRPLQLRHTLQQLAVQTTGCLMKARGQTGKQNIWARGQPLQQLQLLLMHAILLLLHAVLLLLVLLVLQLRPLRLGPLVVLLPLLAERLLW